MFQHPARLYRKEHPDAIPVSVEFDSAGLRVAQRPSETNADGSVGQGRKLEESVAPGSQLISAPLESLSVQLGGHNENKLKISDQSGEWTLILDDRAALKNLITCVQGSTLASQLSEIDKKLAQHPARERNYWNKVLVGGLLIALLSYISLEAIGQLAVSKIDPAWESRFADLLSQSYELKSDTPQAQRVNRIGKRLEASIKDNPYTFRYFVSDSQEVNACALPGGLVTVNEGLLEKATDDELAGVMAHEIGHVIHRDSLRMLVHTMGISSAVGLIMGATHLDKIAGVTNVTAITKNLENLSYSRQQEAAADSFGVRLAVDADFRGSGLIDFFQRMEKEEPNFKNDNTLPLLSNHPMTEERITAIRAELEKLAKERQKNSH